MPKDFPTRSSSFSLTSTGGSSRAQEAGAAHLFPTFVDGHHEVCLCEAIASSAASGRWVAVANDDSAPVRRPGIVSLTKTEKSYS